MSARLGNFVVRHWRLVILAWLALAACLWSFGSHWHDVTRDGDLAYLPRDMPSIRGAALLEEAFPESRGQSRMVIVVAREDGELGAADLKATLHVAERFRDLADSQELPIAEVWTPRTEVVGRMLRSRDRRALLVILRLQNEFMAADNIRVLNRVQEELQELTPRLPAGLQLGVTGSAAVGGDMLDAAARSIRNTELFAVVLVIAILLAVYRAPLLVVVPVASIAVSIFVASHIVATLTQVGPQWGLDWWRFYIFKATRIFVVVILYGAGTDYCLFLIARYKEEIAAGTSHEPAVARALGGVGGALIASALTTIVGLGMMFFARFGKYSNSGPAIAICLLVALAACLTLAPAILVALGRVSQRPMRWATPDGNRQSVFGRLWQRLAAVILARPGTILAVTLLLLLPFAWYGRSVDVTYDLLSELPDNRPSVQGTALLRRHFPPGETAPLTLLIEAPLARFESDRGEKAIARMTKELFDLEGVSNVRSVTEPIGDPPGYTHLFSGQGIAKLAAKQHPLTKARFVTRQPGLAGRVARFDLILENAPFSDGALAALERVESKMAELQGGPDATWSDTSFAVAGTTVGIRDLQQVTQSDRLLIQKLVVLGVFVVLLVVLRRPLICLYLILSVLLSYFVTIGITQIVFSTLYGASYSGLNWTVPLYLFVILIAVGEDYNIYLVTRTLEEQRRLGPQAGLRKALVLTGGIITSCGVIMAGTFVSMMTGMLRGITELGFALTLGVLLDTFVVRTVLVGAFLALLARRQERRLAVEQARVETPPVPVETPAG